MGVQILTDYYEKALGKADIDNLFYELNKALRHKLRKLAYGYKVDLYVVGGACMVAKLQTRDSTCDVDAVWTIGEDMRECINEVADKFGLSHKWCNCDFKKTNSYTEAIAMNCYVYKEYDRLIVRMVNLDLLLAMKLVAFREYKDSDILDCKAILREMQRQGYKMDTMVVCNIVNKYFSVDMLSDNAKRFIGLI